MPYGSEDDQYEREGRLRYVAGSSSHDETIAKAKAWIASQPNAAEWVNLDATL